MYHSRQMVKSVSVCYHNYPGTNLCRILLVIKSHSMEKTSGCYIFLTLMEKAGILVATFTSVNCNFSFTINICKILGLFLFPKLVFLCTWSNKMGLNFFFLFERFLTDAYKLSNLWDTIWYFDTCVHCVMFK